MKSDEGHKKIKLLTPLSIIALFISLSEVVAGIVATQTAGSTQLLLTIFVVIFPTVVALLFFFVLYNRPWVFYHPGEFDGETSVDTFSAAMQRRLHKLDGIVETNSKMVNADDFDKLDSDHVAKDLASKGLIRLRTSEFSGEKGSVLYLPHDAFESVGLMLKYIWHSVGEFSVNSYGIEWLIRNDDTGEIYTRIGSRFARAYLGTRWDDRPLDEIGIRPGTTISLVKPSK